MKYPLSSIALLCGISLPVAPPLSLAHEVGAGEGEGPATDSTTTVVASRPVNAASTFSVSDRTFALRPIGGVQDILRVTPGLVLVQHSGGGKANQYFLRGFDADHGTDLALSIDGVPINMVSHAHGQGFADTNFIIPEVVERVEITKGPYLAAQGDFATAGAVDLISRNRFERQAVAAGLTGSPGHGQAGYRGLVTGTWGKDHQPLAATWAADISRTNGPFDNPDRWDSYRLFGKLTYQVRPSLEIGLGGIGHAGAWRGSGQLPARALERGLVSRFGRLDSDEGGRSARHQLFVTVKGRPTDSSEWRLLAYVATYRFNLFSNFTLFLRDPVNGDDIEQADRRTFCGGKLSYRLVHAVGPVGLDTRIGADARADDIQAELWTSTARRRTAGVRGADIRQALLGVYVAQEIAPFSRLRIDLGGRADFLSFRVDDRLTTGGGGSGGAHQLSPKSSVILAAARGDRLRLDLFGNYGHGFHSNDVRGVFSSPAVTPLVRGVGGELGARARILERFELAAALWRLELASETVWIGDEGTIGVSDGTTRHGVEVEARWQLAPWLVAEADATVTRSRFSAADPGGGGLALSPRRTWSGGLSGRHAARGGVARGGLRFFGIGDRPATDDGALVAPGFTQVDLHLGYRHRRFDVAFDVENLLDRIFSAAQFATTGRLPDEPLPGAPVPAGFSCGRNARLAPTSGGFAGCEDLHVTPAYPLTVRLLATVYVD